MKSFSSTLLCASLVILFFASCRKVIGEGPVETETREANNFTGIDLRMSGEVYYTQSPAYKLEIRAQRNILEVLETYVSNNKLVIKLENNARVRKHEDITINVSAPNLNSLRVSGSGSISASGSLTTDNMDMDVSGSGDITVSEITADYVDASISGSGDINVVNGTATEEKLKITGSGNLDLSNIIAKKATINTTGSGNTSVYVSERLDVTITGSGSVFYRGQPVINTKITGSGKVKPL